MSDLLSEPQFSILTKPLLWSILKRTAATAGSSLEFSSPFPPKKIKKNIDRKARVCKTLITGSNPVDASQKAARKGSFFIVYGVVAVQASTLAWARQMAASVLAKQNEALYPAPISGSNPVDASETGPEEDLFLFMAVRVLATRRGTACKVFSLLESRFGRPGSRFLRESVCLAVYLSPLSD